MFKTPPTAGVAIPSAFGAAKNAFGPPPVRRAASETGTATDASSASATTRGTGRPGGAIGTRAPPPPHEEVAEGEWAEVVYDYSSEVRREGSVVEVTFADDASFGRTRAIWRSKLVRGCLSPPSRRRIGQPFFSLERLAV